jgi:hypothetical protein
MRRIHITLATAVAVLVLAVPPVGADECWVDPSGAIICKVTGGEPAPGAPPGGGGPTDPLRYLRTRHDATVGECWYWARRPPGLDSWDPANDQAIIFTRLALPRCPDSPAEPGVDAAVIAWEIFRSFPLLGPEPVFQPSVGITGLDTVLAADVPASLTHVEELPDGSVLMVEAQPVELGVEWGDGTFDTYLPEAALPYPFGAVTHGYTAKTCAPGYQTSHPSGPNCHHGLEEYPVVTTYTWWGRYRRDGPWIDLGSIELGATWPYDVDEVVGILE